MGYYDHLSISHYNHFHKVVDSKFTILNMLTNLDTIDCKINFNTKMYLDFDLEVTQSYKKRTITIISINKYENSIY